MEDAAGHPPGTVVVAEEQTAGQGRMGRQWHSERGAGLYFSAVLALPCPSDQLPVVTLALGLATQDAIQKVTGVACDLKWPNDVLVDGRKLCGILAEASMEVDEVRIYPPPGAQSSISFLQPSSTSLALPVTMTEIGRLPAMQFFLPTVALAFAMSIYSKYHIIVPLGIS